MNIKNLSLFRWLLGVTLTLALAGSALSMAQASPPAQDPRPPIDNGGGNGGGSDSGGGGNNGDNSSTPGCASMLGQVLNWGFGPQSDVGIELKTGSWQASTTSGSDGNYGLGGLGVGIATLRVAVPPALSAELQPLVQDAGVYLNCDYPVVANLAVYSGDQIDPPASITMEASVEDLAVGDKVDLAITIKNTLPNDITNVIVTDRLPTGLTPLDFTSSRRPTSLNLVDGGEDGQMAVAYFAALPKNAKVTLRLVAQANEKLPGSGQIRNAATLFYRESVADQAWVDFTTGSSVTPIPAAATTNATPPTESAPAATPAAAGEKPILSIPAAPTEEATPAQKSAAEFVAPGNMPVTGNDQIELPLPAAQAPLINSVPVRLLAPTNPSADAAEIAPLTVSPQPIEATRPAASTPVISMPVVVALALLFLGGLTLGSGLKLFHRADIWTEDED